MKRIILWSFVALLMVFTLAAADVSGKWTAQVPGRSGNMRDVTFNFKADGEKLTGTMSGRNGDIQISDGRVSGDVVSFSVTQEFGGNSVKQTFTGKVTGSDIMFKREGGQGAPVEFVAKRP